MEDTLSNRIDYKKPLTTKEQQELLHLLGKRCAQKTKDRLARTLAFVPHIPNYGIYRRVDLDPVSYCAGQSYPDEIRCVRDCLLGKI